MKILIATHGKLWDGFVSAIEIILGRSDKIDAISAHDEYDFKEKVDTYFKEISEPLIVCTDLMIGSVNQYIVSKINDYDFRLFADVNLKFLLELNMMVNSNNTLDEKTIQELLKNNPGVIDICGLLKKGIEE